MTKNEMRQMDGQERKGEFERDGWLTIRDGWLNKREWWLSLFRTKQLQPGPGFDRSVLGIRIRMLDKIEF
jgi:hypothetical protein